MSGRPIPVAVLALIAAVFVLVGGPPAGAAPPGAATLVAPTGVVTGTTHVFTFQGVPEATFYYFHLNDATASPRFTLWYPAGQTCPSGSATCAIVLSEGLAVGGATWWIRTWNPDGYGSWSAGRSFTVAFVPTAWAHGLATAAERFQLVLAGDAVLDRQTGLVWDRAPNISSVSDWKGAVSSCLLNSHGWRLPTVEELSTLDPLPAGHPFTNVLNVTFWSATTSPIDPTTAFYQTLGTSNAIGSTFKVTGLPKWCVRGGPGHVAQ